jgi:heme exporter protein C
MRFTFIVSLIALALLYGTLWKYELTAKNARIQARRLRRMTLGDDAVAPLRRSAAPS